MIERNYHGDHERCRTEMLDCWLNSTTTPTWKAIIKALGHMEQGRVADEIQRKHNVIISNTTTEGKASCSLSNSVMLGHCHSYSYYV